MRGCALLRSPTRLAGWRYLPTQKNWCGERELNPQRSLLAGNTIYTSFSLIWVGISTRLRRNATPHQIHATKLKITAFKFFIATSITVNKPPTAEMDIANPNETATCTSTCTCTSKPICQPHFFCSANVKLRGCCRAFAASLLNAVRRKRRKAITQHLPKTQN